MMRIALLLGKMSLGSRQSVDLATWRATPGMTGTDTGFVRIGEELERTGHTVVRCYPMAPPTGKYDAALAVNEPDCLRGVDASVRACAFWLNDVSFCRAGFDRHCDLFFSPSEAHIEMMRTRPGWRRVEVSPQNPNGVERYRVAPEKWHAVELGCDPERHRFVYNGGTPKLDDGSGGGALPKIPGRCIYASSPDRGLHHVLQEWPKIRKAVPHATLHIFYRLEPWLRGFDQTPFYPPIEALRARANYVEEALRRLGPGSGITVRDAVSKDDMAREMAQAECLAYPCDTIRWSEGFSCTLLEACAAQACPVTLETDALPCVYGGVVPMVPRSEIGAWSDLVIRALRDDAWRSEVNERCGAFAAQRTWKDTAMKMMGLIERELAGKPEAYRLTGTQ